MADNRRQSSGDVDKKHQEGTSGGDRHTLWMAVMVSQDCVPVKPHPIPLDMCRAGVVAQWQSLCEDLGLQNCVQATVRPYSLAGGMGPTKKDREESL